MMKTTIRLGALGCFVAALVMAVPVASANCIPAETFGQISLPSDATTGYHYVNFPAAASTAFANQVGRYWQAGNAANNQNLYDVSNWLVPNGPTQFFLGGNMGDSRSGCVHVEMILVVQAKSTDGTGSFYGVSRVNETPANSEGFAFNRTNADSNLQPVPRPRVTNSGKAGTVVTVDLKFDDSATAFNGLSPSQGPATITGYRLLRQNGAADPGRTPASYTFAEREANVSGGPARPGFQIDCSTVPAGQDVFLATQLEFDNGQVLGDFASGSTRVKCNGTLADPTGYKIIDRKGPATPRSSK